MNDNHTPRSPIRRILVALDASPASLNALHTAVDLAARFQAEVLGLFVEDINLLRLSELPFAREISFYSSRSRPLEREAMEIQLRIQALRIRNTLARIAQTAGVTWRFRTARGDVGAEVLAAGADADLVVLGKIGRSLPGLQRSGSTARMLLMRHRGMTLVLQTRLVYDRRPVAIVYDGSSVASKTLDTAAHLAQLNQVPLLIFIIGADAGRVEDYLGKVRSQLQGRGIETLLRRLVKPSLQALAERIRLETNSMVVIPCLEDWFEADKLCGLVDEMPNPVLLVR